MSKGLIITGISSFVIGLLAVGGLIALALTNSPVTVWRYILLGCGSVCIGFGTTTFLGGLE